MGFTETTKEDIEKKGESQLSEKVKKLKADLSGRVSLLTGQEFAICFNILNEDDSESIETIFKFVVHDIKSEHMIISQHTFLAECPDRETVHEIADAWYEE